MLNKKSLFNIVYAIALIGAVSACVGFLSEFLNVAQLHGMNVTGTYTFEGKGFWIPLLYYFFAFVICTFATTMVILHILNVLKDRSMVNISIIVACGIVFLMSLVLIYFIRYYNDRYQYYYLSYYRYLINYTFRSGALSFIANMGIILFCNIIDSKIQANLIKTQENN
jgi:uncharacterized membrane protein